MKKYFLLIFLLTSTLGFSQILNNEQSSTYAVVVGISDYQDEGIPDLRFADKDAEAFAGYLQSPAGGSLDEDHLKVLINEIATQAQFGAALDWLWEVAQENDKVIIYFSGHGDVERKSITQPGYLLCWDAPPNVYMGGGAFNVRDLNDVVSTISIQNKAKVILVTDACRAGKLSGSGIGGPQATAANLAKQYGNEIKILSCQPDEYSIEGEQWGGGRSAFSYHLLDALYGMADRDDNLQIDLKEIERYLEDHVSREVEPHHQLPMTVGNGREKLTDVFPEILAQLKEGRKGQMQMFTATDTRGIEDDVLAQADSNIMEMYFAFQKSLKDKQFLSPSDACTDVYYKHLIKEPALERLHSSMRRNYAAALQDEAQQELNAMLKTEKAAYFRTWKIKEEANRTNPAYLARAAELLGEKHYMYPILQARKWFFKAYLFYLSDKNKTKGEKTLEKFREALKWEPDLPHAYLIMSDVFTYNLYQFDSAQIYAHRALNLAPSWLLPYSRLAIIASRFIDQPEQARAFLQQADQIDSNSVVLWYRWGQFHLSQKNYEEAEKMFLKVLDNLDASICYPCTYIALGRVYLETERLEEAEKQYRKALELSSYNIMNLGEISVFFQKTGQKEEEEKLYLKGIELEPDNSWPYLRLGQFCFKEKRYKEAEQAYQKAIQLDSTYLEPYRYLADLYRLTKRYDEAEELYLKLIQMNPNMTYLYFPLGQVYMNENRFDEAVLAFNKIIQLFPKWNTAYYNLACIQSLQSQANEGFDNLEKAFENGYKNYKWLQEDPDLILLRQQKDRWDKLMLKFFPEQQRE